jgi:CBS domain-containing protein
VVVRDIMESDVPTVSPGDPVERAIRLLREHDLPGVPVVDEDGRCVGIITENDLVIADEEGDLHLPHYVELFGGVIYLEPLRRFEERLR